MSRTDGFWIPKPEELFNVGLNKEDASGYISFCERYISEHQNLKENLSKLQPPPENLFKRLPQPANKIPPEKISEYLSKIVVLKLNGGIGTTMGLDIPRCALPLTGDKIFLDVIVRQIEDLNSRFKVSIPLVLMNSIHTHSEVLKLLERYSNSTIKIHTFFQTSYPRLSPVTWSITAKKPYSEDSEENWYPPGSGDVFDAFNKSGLLEKFLKQGKEYVFISNVENLGAIVGRDEFRVLGEIFSTKTNFILEVTERYATDFRGGILVHDQTNNKPFVVQMSQIPKKKRNYFSPKVFTYWNTNNIWVKLDELQVLLGKSGLKLPVSKNIKNGFIQFETYAGSAIKEFQNTIALIVPRTRFREIKTTANLFAHQSNLFTLSHGAYLLPNEARATQGFSEQPVVRFDTEHFGNIDDYKKRFPSIPNILELEHLNVAGDVTFGFGVKLSGCVIIVAEDTKKIKIPDGSVLENCVISGELQIVDH